MIDLIRELRKRAPEEAKHNIKFANPDVIEELILLYQDTNDTIFKALVKELCTLAGEPWITFLNGPQEQEQKFVTKVYRGQTVSEPVTSKPAQQEAEEKPVRMYRGHVIK